MRKHSYALSKITSTQRVYKRSLGIHLNYCGKSYFIVKELFLVPNRPMCRITKFSEDIVKPRPNYVRFENTQYSDFDLEL